MSNRELAESYAYLAEWDDEDRLYVAVVKEWPGIAAHGKTEEEAIKEAQHVIEGCLVEMAEFEEIPPVPLSLKKV